MSSFSSRVGCQRREAGRSGAPVCMNRRRLTCWGDALVLWLIFEEAVDYMRFESAAAPYVRDWWSELVLAAHDLPITQVWTRAIDCAGKIPMYSCITLSPCKLDRLHVLAKLQSMQPSPSAFD